MSKPRILIVDDAKTSRALIAAFIEKMGCEIIGEASNGIEAEELFKERHPDLTLLDIEMPQRNGIETLKRLVKLNPASRVVMLTGEDNTVVAESCFHNGASGYLQKALSPERLKNTLQTHINSIAS